MLLLALSPPIPDLIDPFVEYCRLRLADDPHLWASTLLDELQPWGFTGSYQSLTAAIRGLGLRPGFARRVTPPGAVTWPSSSIHRAQKPQFDWVELADPPPA